MTAPDTLGRALDWHDQGTCAENGRDPEKWDADRGTDDAIEARRLCWALCPVRIKCLTYALEAEGSAPVKHRHGVAGGLDSTERYWLARGLKDRQTAAEDAQKRRAWNLHTAGVPDADIAELVGVCTRTLIRWRRAKEAAAAAESQALAA